MKLDRVFLLPQGLPDRPLYRHAIISPSKYDSYSAGSFPGKYVKDFIWIKLKFINKKYKTGLVKTSRPKNIELLGIKSNLTFLCTSTFQIETRNNLVTFLFTLPHYSILLHVLLH